MQRASCMAETYKIIGGDGVEYGPATLEEIRSWCEEGRVSPGTLVWRGDEQRWLPAGGRPELQWDLPQPEPASVRTAAPPVLPTGLRPAGFWIRLGAYLLDWLILTLLVAVLTLPWSKPLAELQEAALTEARRAQAIPANAGERPDYSVIFRFWLVSLAINLPVSLVYFVSFNGMRGGTPGKLLLGLRVLREDGSPLGLGRALLRHVAQWLSTLPLFLGYLMIATDPRKRGLHDQLARTQVVFVR